MIMEYRTNEFNSTKQKNLALSVKFWILTLFLILVYSSLLFAQYSNTVYLDPSNSGDPDQDGTYEHPYDDISDLGSLDSDTEFLIKRGTTMDTDGQIVFDLVENSKFGAYGSGDERPIFTSSADYPVRFDRSTNCWIDSIRVIGNPDLFVTAPIAVSGFWSAGLP